MVLPLFSLLIPKSMCLTGTSPNILFHWFHRTTGLSGSVTLFDAGWLSPSLASSSSRGTAVWSKVSSTIEKEKEMHAWLRKMVFSRVLRDSTPRYVGPSVGWSPFYFFGVFELFEHMAPAQMP